MSAWAAFVAGVVSTGVGVILGYWAGKRETLRRVRTSFERNGFPYHVERPRRERQY